MLADMTRGNPLKQILAFSVPMLIGNIFQQVYSLVDSMIVGRFVGAQSLAAVGATSTIFTVMTSLMMGLTNGAGIIISQCFGARRFGELRITVTGLIYIVAAISAAVSVAGVIFSPAILTLLNTPENVMPEASVYIRIIFSFTIGMATYNATGALLRSLGDSRTPLYALMLSSLINVGLDLLFVLVFKTGVAGAAAATVISQIISAVYCIAHIIRNRKRLKLTGLTFRTTNEAVCRIFKAGLPAALESCLISLGTMSVQRLVNSFGSMTMAAYTASTRIDSIAVAPIVSIGNAISIFTGQNMGAGNIDRIKRGLYQTLAALAVLCVIIASFIVIFRTRLLSLFLDSSASEAVAIGSRYLTVVCVAYIMAAVMRSYLNVLRGAGDVNTSAISGVTELAGRIIFAYILVRPLGSTGIWTATPIAWAMGAAVPVIRYYSGKWQSKKLV